MQLKQWELYWEAVFPFKPNKMKMKEQEIGGRFFSVESWHNPGVQRETFRSPRLAGWGSLINGGYCRGGLAFVLNTERHQTLQVFNITQ